jgi:chemotaxis protein methyltransferase CheR
MPFAIMDASFSLSDTEFGLFQRLIYKLTGIHLADSKKVLLVGRLGKRLRALGLERFEQYYRLLATGEYPDELQTMVDLITTNETYFFREPAHFEWLARFAREARSRPLRVWSAASSSGEEAYTIAMVLADELGVSGGWEIVASDISLSVLEKARLGHYPMERGTGISQPHLKKYCLRGVRRQEGTFLVIPELGNHIRFLQINLLDVKAPDIGSFDVIFLRNVMIYFDMPTKQRVITNMLPYLKPDGYFIVGHSETLNGVSEALNPVRPTLYRLRQKP